MTSLSHYWRGFRSQLFYVSFLIFGLIFTAMMIVCVMFNRRGFQTTARIATWVVFGIQRLLLGTRHEYRGRENIPTGPCIVAVRHESFWETFVCGIMLPFPTWILKRELLTIPLVGRLLRTLKCVGIDRTKGIRALSDVSEQAKERMDNYNAQVVIFPHGTRLHPDDFETPWKRGIINIYEKTNVPCVPIALTCSSAWPRYPRVCGKGPMIAEFLPAIPAGLSRKEFSRALDATITERSRELRAEALRRGAALPRNDPGPPKQTKEASQSRVPDAEPADAAPAVPSIDNATHVAEEAS